MTNKEVLKKAVEQFGMNPQIDMVIEECAELIQALNKVKRMGGMLYKNSIMKPVNYESTNHPTTQYAMAYANLCGEVADVKIMIGQLEEMLDKETIDLCEERKIERLKEKLK